MDQNPIFVFFWPLIDNYNTKGEPGGFLMLEDQRYCQSMIKYGYYKESESKYSNCHVD